MSKEEIQRRYIELKILEQQASQMQQQLLLLDNQLSMLERTKESINDLDTIKPGSQAFIPLGQGVFLKGEIKDTKNLLVGVGANIAVSKTAEQSKGVIEKQISELRHVIMQLEEQIQQLTIHARALEEEMQALASKE